jgi:hypothetical protein
MRVANPRAADRPAGGWPPAGHIIMTPKLPPDYHPFSVPLIMEFTLSLPIFILPSWPMPSPPRIFPGFKIWGGIAPSFEYTFLAS